MRTKSFFLILACVALFSAPGTANAASVISQWFPGETNLISDDNAEFLFNINGGATTVDVGDVLIGISSIHTVSGSSSSGTNMFGTGGVNEFTAVFAAEVIGRHDHVVDPGDPARADFDFGPVTAAALALIAADGTMPDIAAEIASWAAGTMAAFYDDPADDFSRLGPDDGAPDTGVGPFKSENANFLTANGGTRIFELGFSANPDPDNNVFWTAGDAFVDIAQAGAVPSPANAGGFNAGLNITANNTGLPFARVANFDPVGRIVAGAHVPGTKGFGTSDFFVSGSIVGTGGVNTPFDVFSDFNATFVPLPEPGSLTLLGLGGLFAAAAGWRRRRQA